MIRNLTQQLEEINTQSEVLNNKPQVLQDDSFILDVETLHQQNIEQEEAKEILREEVEQSLIDLYGDFLGRKWGEAHRKAEAEAEARGEAPTPPLLTRGEHPKNRRHRKAFGIEFLKSNKKTKLDWVSFTTKDSVEILEQFLALAVNADIVTNEMGHGMQGYTEVKEIVLKKQVIGRIGYGMDHGRNLLTLTGSGCDMVKDWDEFKYWYDRLLETKLTRVDVAADFFCNSVNYEKTVAAYENLEFKADKSPVNPSFKKIEAGTGNGVNLGRTFYVGRSTSGKSLRAYEKGYEQLAQIIKKKSDDELDKFVNEHFKHKINLKNWFRVEVQLMGKSREILSDIFIKSDEYFAGAYPFCSRILGFIKGIIAKVRPKNIETNLAKKVENLRNHYGKFINTYIWLARLKGEDVFKKLVGLSAGLHDDRQLVASGLYNEYGYQLMDMLAFYRHQVK